MAHRSACWNFHSVHHFVNVAAILSWWVNTIPSIVVAVTFKRLHEEIHSVRQRACLLVVTADQCEQVHQPEIKTIHTHDCCAPEEKQSTYFPTEMDVQIDADPEDMQVSEGSHVSTKND